MECAKILGCSRDQVRAFIAAGELVAVNVGLGRQRTRYRVQETELQAFIERRTTKPPRSARKPQPKPTREWV